MAEFEPRSVARRRLYIRRRPHHAGRRRRHLPPVGALRRGRLSRRIRRPSAVVFPVDGIDNHSHFVRRQHNENVCLCRGTIGAAVPWPPRILR